jgi:hypothetical protein
MEELIEKKGGRKWSSIVYKCLALFVVFLFCSITIPCFEEMLFQLSLGWFFFLKENLTRIDFGWEMIASSLIGMALCVWLTHSFCQWVMREKNAAPWRFIQTLRLNLLVMLFFSASCALVGCVHQSLWLLSNPVVVNHGKNVDIVRNRINMRQIQLLILDFEGEHGKFPDSLEDLRKENHSTWGDIFFARKNKMVEPFLYLGKGLSSSDLGSKVILISPFVDRNRLAHVRIDGSAKDEIIAEGKKGQEQFEKMIRDGVWPTPSPETDSKR